MAKLKTDSTFFMRLGEFFAFRKMVSLSVVKLVYIAGLIAAIAWSISLMAQGGINIIAGILVLTFGNLIWRLNCELWILFFSMHEVLKSAEKHLGVLSDSIREK